MRLWPTMSRVFSSGGPSREIVNALKEDVIIEKFAPPVIALGLGPQAKPDLLQVLKSHLKAWTGQDWQLELVQAKAGEELGPSLGQQERQAAEQQMQSARQSAEVKRIQEIFPGAQLQRVIAPTKSAVNTA